MGIKTYYSDPSYIFSGGQDPRTPMIYAPELRDVGLLILRKIIKIVATRCQILRLKCTKFDFGWGSPRPTSWI